MTVEENGMYDREENRCKGVNRNMKMHILYEKLEYQLSALHEYILYWKDFGGWGCLFWGVFCYFLEVFKKSNFLMVVLYSVFWAIANKNMPNTWLNAALSHLHKTDHCWQSPGAQSNIINGTNMHQCFHFSND